DNGLDRVPVDVRGGTIEVNIGSFIIERATAGIVHETHLKVSVGGQRFGGIVVDEDVHPQAYLLPSIHLDLGIEKHVIAGSEWCDRAG
ncbi:MAG: hypothetical protein ACXVAV_15820, partial [Ktedonobacteraceae bacterium]